MKKTGPWGPVEEEIKTSRKQGGGSESELVASHGEVFRITEQDGTRCQIGEFRSFEIEREAGGFIQIPVHTDSQGFS